MRQVAAMLKAIHAQENRTAAQERAVKVVAELCEMALAKAADLIDSKFNGTLTYYSYPPNPLV
ncbi:hypothetical protein [uncultured Spongiibacter sp.]|uniref:hypothetical protein n=1 Tax=Spongiibacter nanhainus TaxID=2794344 RepID=UPI00338EABD3